MVLNDVIVHVCVNVQSLTDYYCRRGCLFEPHCLSTVVVSLLLQVLSSQGWTAMLILMVGESRCEKQGVWLSWNESMDKDLQGLRGMPVTNKKHSMNQWTEGLVIVYFIIDTLLGTLQHPTISHLVIFRIRYVRVIVEIYICSIQYVRHFITCMKCGVCVQCLSIHACICVWLCVCVYTWTAFRSAHFIVY